MKILFVCSCLEPGMDGVGDYTRILAGRLNARGHPCALLALADLCVKEPAVCDFGEPGLVLKGLRLPSKLTWPERLRAAIEFCATFQPDWISWQIVLYGFDRRGLSFGLGRRLREIARPYKNQIMFHEVWIGEAKESSLKKKMMGMLQKRIVKDLLKKVRPLVVHTHTPLYQHLLGRLGQRAKLLPLFGNIPLETKADPEWLLKKGPEGGAQFHETDRKKWWIFVIFGSIHPEWDANDFRLKALAAARLAGKKCLLISVGRAGEAGGRILRELQSHEGNLWRVLPLGPQSAAEVSQCLLAADFGVSAVPPENVFKSGTAVAMIEHGLPVIVTRPTGSYRNCPPEILLTGMRNVARHFELRSLQKSKPQRHLPEVAAQFIKDLGEA